MFNIIKNKLKIAGRKIKKAYFAFPVDFAPEDKERFIKLLRFPESIDDKTLTKSLEIVMLLTIDAGDAELFKANLHRHKILVSSPEFFQILDAVTTAYTKMDHPAAAMYPKFRTAIENEFAEAKISDS